MPVEVRLVSVATGEFCQNLFSFESFDFRSSPFLVSFLVICPPLFPHTPCGLLWEPFSSTVTFHAIHYRDSFAPKGRGSVGVQVGFLMIALVERVHVPLGHLLSFINVLWIGMENKAANPLAGTRAFCQGK